MSKYLMFENKIVEADGKPVLIDINDKTITANGEYKPASEGLTGYGTITVNVQPTLGEKHVTTNQTLIAKDEGLDGYSKVVINVRDGEPYRLAEKTITAEDMLSGNIFNAEIDSVDGYSSVTVDLPVVDKTINDISESNEFFAANDGAYGYRSVTVDVKTGASDEELIGYNLALNLVSLPSEAKELFNSCGLNIPDDFRLHTNENVVCHDFAISSNFLNSNPNIKTFKQELFYNGKNTPISLWEFLIRYAGLNFAYGIESGGDPYSTSYINSYLAYEYSLREQDINSIVLGNPAAKRFDITNPTKLYGGWSYAALTTSMGDNSIANCDNLESIEIEGFATEGLIGNANAAFSHNYKLKSVDVKPSVSSLKGYSANLIYNCETSSLYAEHQNSVFDCDISLEELNLYGASIIGSVLLFHNCYSLKTLVCGLLNLDAGNSYTAFQNSGIEHIVCDNIQRNVNEYGYRYGSYSYSKSNKLVIPNLKSIVIRSPFYFEGSEFSYLPSYFFKSMPDQQITTYIPNINYVNEETGQSSNTLEMYTNLLSISSNVTVKSDTELYGNDSYLLLPTIIQDSGQIIEYTVSRICPAMKQTDGHATTWRDWINSEFNLDKIGIYDGYTGNFTFDADEVELTFKIPEGGCVCRCATSGIIQPLVHMDIFSEILYKISQSRGEVPVNEINALLANVFISPEDPLPVVDIGSNVSFAERHLFVNNETPAELTDLEKQFCIGTSPYTSFFAPTLNTNYRTEQTKLQKKPTEIIYNEKSNPTENDITTFALKQYYGEDYDAKNDINNMSVIMWGKSDSSNKFSEAVSSGNTLIGVCAYGSPKNPYIAHDIFHHVIIPEEPFTKELNNYFVRITYQDFIEYVVGVGANDFIGFHFNKMTHRIALDGGDIGIGSLDYPFGSTEAHVAVPDESSSCLNFLTTIIDYKGHVRRDYKDYTIEVFKPSQADIEAYNNAFSAIGENLYEYTDDDLFKEVCKEENKIYNFTSPKYAQPGVINLKYFYEGLDNVQIKVEETGQIWKRYNSGKSDMVNAYEEGWIAGWRPIE